MKIPSSLLAVSILFIMVTTGVARAQTEEATAKIPDGSALVEHVPEGIYFVSKPLMDELERLKESVRNLEDQVEKGFLKPELAKEELNVLRQQLAKTREKISEEKFLVKAFESHVIEEEGTFELGPERLLILNADRIRVRGWSGPHVKYVLKKIVYSNDEDVSEEMAGIHVEQTYEEMPNFVGMTPEQRAADEEKFLSTPDGQKLTAEQRANREKFLREIADGFRYFKRFQGRKINYLTLKGLIWQEGNRQLTYRYQGDQIGRMGSMWKRHAELTVYVPKCEAIALFGCEAGLDVKGTNGDLIITNRDSHDRDYAATFQIDFHHGDLMILESPIDRIAHVEGNVTIEATTEMVNSGNHHSAGFRTHSQSPARRCEIDGVNGDVQADFSRAELVLSSIHGVIDVNNDYGDSTLTISQDMGQTPCRLISQSGSTKVVIQKDALVNVPIFLATDCGVLRTNLDRDKLEDSMFTTTSSLDSQRHDWTAFHTPVEGDPFAKFQLFERVDAILSDQIRSAGLDVISHAGRVELIQE